MSHESSYESGQRFSKFKMADVAKLRVRTVNSNPFQQKHYKVFRCNYRPLGNFNLWTCFSIKMKSRNKNCCAANHRIHSQYLFRVLRRPPFWILKAVDLTHNLTHGSLTHDSLTHDSLTHDSLTHDSLTHDSLTHWIMFTEYSAPGWKKKRHISFYKTNATSQCMTKHMIRPQC